MRRHRSRYSKGRLAGFAESVGGNCLERICAFGFAYIARIVFFFFFFLLWDGLPLICGDLFTFFLYSLARLSCAYLSMKRGEEERNENHCLVAELFESLCDPHCDFLRTR